MRTTATTPWRPSVLIIGDLPVRAPPTIEGNIVHISVSDGTSQVYVETENFIAVDFMIQNGSIRFYMFLDGIQVDWNKLDDGQRMIMRANIKTYISDNGWDEATLAKYCPGEYMDSRYYILEALT